mgnify:FL=1
MRNFEGFSPGKENFTFGHKISGEQPVQPAIDLSQTDFDEEAKKALIDLNREKGLLLSKANLSAKEKTKLSELDDQINMFKNARQKGTIASA